MADYNASYTAISTYKVYLMHSANGTTYEKLVDIKEFPDLGGTPETLQTTTTSDSMQTSILGIQSLDSLEFRANYNKADFAKLKAISDSDFNAPSWYAVYFGEDGVNGKFSFKGQLSVFPNGGGINEVVDMTITIAASTEITPDVGE